MSDLEALEAPAYMRAMLIQDVCSAERWMREQLPNASLLDRAVIEAELAELEATLKRLDELYDCAVLRRWRAGGRR